MLQSLFPSFEPPSSILPAACFPSPSHSLLSLFPFPPFSLFNHPSLILHYLPLVFFCLFCLFIYSPPLCFFFFFSLSPFHSSFPPPFFPMFPSFIIVYPLTLLTFPSPLTTSSPSSPLFFFSSFVTPRGETLCASCCSKGSAGIDGASLAGMRYTVRVSVHMHTRTVERAPFLAHTDTHCRHCRCCIKINELSLANQVSRWEGDGIPRSGIGLWRSSL